MPAGSQVQSGYSSAELMDDIACRLCSGGCMSLLECLWASAYSRPQDGLHSPSHSQAAQSGCSWAAYGYIHQMYCLAGLPDGQNYPERQDDC